MWTNFAKGKLSNLKGDMFGGITAAVIALPLALAFGVASGLGPAAGLYGAIAVGFYAAIFGGTPAQVSGPTGPMTVVMASVIATHTNSLPEAFTIVMLGGIFQILFGLVKVGGYVRYTPYSVVSGFMTGIGVIIILIQTLPFLGLPTVPGGPVGALVSLARTDLSGITIDAPALAIIALLTVVFWPKNWQRFVPAPLAALVIGSLAGLFMFPAAPDIGNIPTGLPALHAPSVNMADLAGVLQAGLVLALLGSIDSLLTSIVADSITRTNHDSNKELIGQGIGNIAAGIIGGLPGAGATMRTVINVRAGGRTPLSGALHSVVLLLLLIGLGPVAEHIPLAVLAGILMKVGWDIIDWGYLRYIHRVPMEKTVVMLITFGLTVFVDLITAVAVGIILAAYVNARALGEQQLKGISSQTGEDTDVGVLSDEEVEMMKSSGHSISLVRLRGSFSYASARQLSMAVITEDYPEQILIYDLTEAAYVDPSAAMALKDMISQALERNCQVLVSGLSGKVEAILKGFGVIALLDAENIYPARKDAIVAASDRVRSLETKPAADA